VHEYKALKQPIVTFDRRIADIPYVSSDNYRGGVLAAELLIAKGCRIIAHICGNLSLDLLSNRRSEGFIDTLREHEIEPIVVQLGTDVFESSDYERVIGALFEAHPEVDGLFASSDIVAMNAIKVCMGRGIRIPEQLKLIGYDDIQFASLMNPTLTTIRQPLEEMSRLAVDLIDGLAAGQQVPMENTLPVTLVERDST
jgi:LacI family sucrose operon transcriptional repressor